MSASPAADLLPAMTPRSQRRVGASVRAVSLDSLGGGRWGGDANATRGGAAEGVGGSLRRLVRRGFFFSLLFFGFCLRGFLESVEEFACAPVRLVTRICLFFKKWVANGQR
jgi:hypothetical protein